MFHIMPFFASRTLACYSSHAIIVDQLVLLRFSSVGKKQRQHGDCFFAAVVLHNLSVKGLYLYVPCEE